MMSKQLNLQNKDKRFIDLLDAPIVTALMVKLLNDPTAHAEIIAITSAANTIKNWQLKDCEIFTTLEPCIMCSGAIMNSRIKNIYFGAYDKKFGGCSSLYNICNDLRLKHRCGIKGGIMEIDCKWIIDDFFQKLRK